VKAAIERMLHTCASADSEDVLAVWSCLAAAAKGFRPRPCHEDLRTKDMEGHSSAVADAAFYTFISQ
jgi:hypothetical protein